MGKIVILINGKPYSRKEGITTYEKVENAYKDAGFFKNNKPENKVQVAEIKFEVIEEVQ